MASKPRASAEKVALALERALAGDAEAWAAARDVLRGTLPSGIPPALVARFWAEKMRFGWVYFRLRWVTDEYAEATVAGLCRWHDPAATFLTSAIADWPHQMRILDVRDEDNGWLTITSVALDFATEGDPLGARGRSLAISDLTGGWTVPQILIDGKPIGGYVELWRLEKEGKLAA